MKWIIAIWLICAGSGVSFSVVSERKRRVDLLKEMENSLKKLTYYMYQWKMPVEEAFKHVAGEEKGRLKEFYRIMHEALTEKTAENLGDLWQENSSRYLEKEKLERTVWTKWQECFLHIPMEPEALNKRLLLRAEEINAYRVELEGKYKGEQKLVLTLGVFVGAFLCLILW